MPRPKTFKDYTGNESAKKILQEAITACRIQKTILPHILLYGSPGTGKTTLAQVIAAEAGYSIITTIGSVIKTQTDLLKLNKQLWNITYGNASPALFIDEIHNIDNPTLRETTWYPILEDFTGYSNLKGKIIEVDNTKYKLASNTYGWPVFCCIGATTDPGMLTAALRRRFKIQIYIDDYSIKDIEEILKHIACKSGYTFTSSASRFLAERSRDNPATAISCLETAIRKSIVQMNSSTKLDIPLIKQTMQDLGIKDSGLKVEDIKVLKILSKTPKGMGKNNIAQACGLSSTHYTEMIEPFLKRRGWIVTSYKTFITPDGLELLKEIKL